VVAVVTAVWQSGNSSSGSTPSNGGGGASATSTTTYREVSVTVGNVNYTSTDSIKTFTVTK
jgi:hypothetical protein